MNFETPSFLTIKSNNKNMHIATLFDFIAVDNILIQSNIHSNIHSNILSLNILINFNFNFNFNFN